MYIRGKYFYDFSTAEDAKRIRQEIFEDEQGFTHDVVFDDKDDISIHAVVYDEENIPRAAGRIYFTGEDYLIGRIGVMKESRGKKLGDFLVRMLVDKAFLAGADRVIVHAQLHAVKFYEKIGFKPYGEQFTEAGVLHQSMQLKNGELLKECHKNNQPCNLA